MVNALTTPPSFPMADIDTYLPWELSSRGYERESCKKIVYPLEATTESFAIFFSDYNL